jgi:Fe-S-cluster containining protein
VNAEPAPLVRCLSIHADYRCRDSGACCSSAWPIPIEVPQYEQLVAALADGSIAVVDSSAEAEAGAGSSRPQLPPRPPFAPHRGLPEGATAVLAHTDDGRCVFYEADAKRCRIHRVKGHAALPMACQQFPRMCLLDPRGIQITLSHYCPTAADLLFVDRPLAIVRHPLAFPPDFPYEGLDARTAFPPLLRPGVLLDWHTLDEFETHAIRALDAETRSVDAALARLDAWAERLRTWRDSDGPLAETFARIVRVESETPVAGTETPFTRGTPSINFETVFQLDAEVRAAVPPGSVIQSAPSHLLEAYRRWVAPAWPAFTRPLCRYLAAKLFANWCWYQGHGLRSLIRSLHAALAVLRLEAARQTHANGRMLEARLLREAFRQTDLLLIHLCAQETLARGWAAAE